MRILILCLLLQCSIGVFGQAISFSVEGKLTGWKEKEQLALFYMQGNELISDTIYVVDGTFKFSGKVDGAVEARLSCISSHRKGQRDKRTFFLDKGKVTIKGSDSLKTAVVTGRDATKDFEELQVKFAPLMERFIAIRMKGMTMDKAQHNSEAYKSLVAANSEVMNALYECRKEFVFSHPASVVSLDVITQITQSAFDLAKIQPLYDALSPAVKELPAGMKLGKVINLAKTTRIGAVLPDFSSLDTLRQPLTLHEVVKKGKLTLVDFWASWCKPCRAENPNVVKAFKAFHDKGFNIISVSLDQNEASWKKAIAKDGMPWYHVSSLKDWDEPIVLQYGITGVPDSFLLDGEGKVVARGLKAEALYNKIQEILF